ncbi:hypothetical protein C8R48DRAFT_740706 [Suillus tomentosus]|nr:hypothetical protein C8R48DRAFT_740706 [Suillus tomentosus]
MPYYQQSVLTLWGRVGCLAQRPYSIVLPQRRTPFASLNGSAFMATKSEVIDNSKSIASSPPSYDTSSNIRIKCRQPSIFSFLSVRQRRATVLPRIRDLVSTTNLSPSSIELIANKCAYDLTATELSDLLQTLNIEGHTALYWAIVNHRQEAFSAFRLFISKLSSECSSDLRLACMRTSDHALFLKLNLQNTDAQDKSLRQFLGCPPDEIEVHDVRGLDDNQFVASFHIRMFQKRLCTTRKLKCEFIARGRIWSLGFEMGRKGKWIVGFGLSSPSLPVSPVCYSIVVETLTRKGESGRETPPKRVFKGGSKTCEQTHVPLGYIGKVDGEKFERTSWTLGDQLVTYDDLTDVDCDKILHAKLEMTLKKN